MIKITTRNDLERDLTKKLLDDNNTEDRCPNLQTDNHGPYCARDLEEGEIISERRRRICDNASLQLWCLDKDRYNLCIWYNGEPFD